MSEKSIRDVVEPLTPELVLVDPELARLARDQLPAPGEGLSSSSQPFSSDESLGNPRPEHSRPTHAHDGFSFPKLPGGTTFQP